MSEAQQEGFIDEIRKNDNESIRFVVQDFKGTRVIDMRVWAKLEDGKVVPTKKGITLSANSYQPFMASLYKVGEHLKNLPEKN